MLLCFFEILQVHILSASWSIKNGEFLLSTGRHEATVSFGPLSGLPRKPPRRHPEKRCGQECAWVYCADRACLPLLFFLPPPAPSFSSCVKMLFLAHSVSGLWVNFQSPLRLSWGNGVVTKGKMSWLPELVSNRRWGDTFAFQGRSNRNKYVSLTKQTSEAAAFQEWSSL